LFIVDVVTGVLAAISTFLLLLSLLSYIRSRVGALLLPLLVFSILAFKNLALIVYVLLHPSFHLPPLHLLLDLLLLLALGLSLLKGRGVGE